MAPRLIGIVILALGLLPLSNWIPGGEVDVEYGARLLDWANGLALCAVVGVLAWYLASRRARETSAPSVATTPTSTNDGWRVDLSVALVAVCLYATIARLVFSGRPLLIDEIVQVLQARWYAAGLVSVPTSEPREFYSILHLVDLGSRTFSQFPAGGPAMLAVGSLVGAEWMVGPVAGGASVFLFARLLRQLEPEAGAAWRLATTVLFAVAPFGAFMFGSHMNHATVLPWLLLAVLGLASLDRDVGSHRGWALTVGLGLGVAATIRPVDAAAFALPAAIWLLWRARRGGRAVGDLLLSGVGVSLPLAALFWVNAQTTGEPLLFGYDQLWGSGHSLGFHRSPWGPEHTPARGLELLSLYLTRLSVYLFESPFPALVPAAVSLLLARHLQRLDRYLLISAGMLLAGYAAYWHDGFYLGPRFVFPLLPALVLWSARLPRLLASRFTFSAPVWTGLRVALLSGAAYALYATLTVRMPQYRNGMTSMRTPIEARSAAAGVHDALVLVKESWGARLVARMWALDVGRSDAEVLYRTADACKLDLAVRALERQGVRGVAARDRLAVLRADSALLVKSPLSPDFTERMLPGFSYPVECQREIDLDREGFSHLAPLRLARDGNVYVRWLPGRESEIAAQYPGRAVYLLGRAGSEVESPLTWTRLSP